MSKDLDDNYWLEDDNPLRTSRGMAKINEETTYRTKCCWEHELNCGKDVFNELFDEIQKENPEYLDSVSELAQLSDQTDLSPFTVVTLTSYALLRRAEEDIRETNCPLGKKIGED